MKKTRNVLIAVILILLIGSGSLYAVWRFAGSENKPVKVVPVSTLDYNAAYDFYGYYDEEEEGSIEGTIISRDSQHISLESDLELKEVKVKEGDRVKKGDVLLVYDMTMKELEKELADLQVQMSRIYLAKAERDLEKLRAKYPSLYEAAVNSQTKVEDISLMTETDMEKSASVEQENPARTASDEPAEDLLTLADEEPEALGADEPGDLIVPDEEDDAPEVEIVDDPDELQFDEEDGEEDNPPEDELFILDEEDPEEGQPAGDDDVISLIDDEEEESQTSSEETETDSGSDIIDPGDEDDDDDSLIDISPGDEEDENENSDTVRLHILTDFLAAVNVLSGNYSSSRYELELDDVIEAQDIFENELGIESSDPVILNPDAFGEKRRVPIYLLSHETMEMLERAAGDKLGFSVDEMVLLLEQGYLRTLYFRLIGEMNKLLPNGKKTTDLTGEEVVKLEKRIRRAADAYYQVYYYWRYLADKYSGDKTMRAYLKDYQTALKTFSVGKNDKEGVFPGKPGLGAPNRGQLSRLITRLLDQQMIEPTTESTEKIEPETDWFDDDFGGFDDYGDEDYDEPPEEEMFTALQEAKAKQIDLRTEELKLKKAQEELAKGTVVAGIDGIVRQAGSMEEGAVMDDFIVIFGGKGLYVMGTVSEFKRDTIKIGDTVNGTTEEGIEFTARITEVSDYPAEGDSDGFGFYSSGMENTTASHYPFYAYIEDDTDISEGYATLSLEGEKNKVKEIQLEKMFIRQDPNGRSYVYAAGKDGKLEKRYVTVAAADYYISVTDGLTDDDLIAFPYGDNVREGAAIVEASSLYDDEDEIYW